MMTMLHLTIRLLMLMHPMMPMAHRQSPILRWIPQTLTELCILHPILLLALSKRIRVGTLHAQHEHLILHMYIHLQTTLILV